ncbi:formate dehydrogenase accessory sulfurtransferase FdhD [Microbulbifer hainanensis]|uniref:formate dehydrogenase accessory sulfurtransferase FdhD n=1 Tax=Microbulbifer hainanensis TaxID=2735675 RepID=UPI0029C06E3E|nr:formate dehydrogenase accessory sulfurtransferase FdhD [Microbulbifer hainanensis]
MDTEEIISQSYDYGEFDAATVVTSQALAEEAAVAISYNGINHAVMMATPADLEDFMLGFSLSGGLIESIDDVRDIEMQEEGDAISVEVTLGSRAFASFRAQRRTLVGISGCGLCGVAALEQVFSDLPMRHPRAMPPAMHLRGLRDRFAAAQTLVQRSGAMHGALYVDSQGETRVCREDIGRHNALDKLLGACHRQGLDLDDGFIALTSRCSLELIHKAVRSGVASLVSLSAPTTMSVRWARQYNLNLIHQPQHSPARYYSPAPCRLTGE